MTTITKTRVANKKRIKVTADLFGVNFPLRLEPFIYAITDHIAEHYHGGYWHFYELSNGGFYMALDSDTPLNVSCENGFEGALSGDALGIAVCLYAYSHLSFDNGPFAETCAEHYYLLRDYMFEHPEVVAILGVID